MLDRYSFRKRVSSVTSRKIPMGTSTGPRSNCSRLEHSHSAIMRPCRKPPNTSTVHCPPSPPSHCRRVLLSICPRLIPISVSASDDSIFHSNSVLAPPASRPLIHRVAFSSPEYDDSILTRSSSKSFTARYAWRIATDLVSSANHWPDSTRYFLSYSIIDEPNVATVNDNCQAKPNKSGFLDE